MKRLIITLKAEREFLLVSSSSMDISESSEIKPFLIARTLERSFQEMAYRIPDLKVSELKVSVELDD